MEHKINYTAESRRDLDEIWNYITSELQNESAAERIVSKIMDAVEQLKSFSELGPSLSTIIDIKSDYRYLVIENYLTFYRILGPEIRIERVLYGRRNYVDILLEGAAEQKTEL